MSVKKFITEMKKSFQKDRKRLLRIVKSDELDCKMLEIPFSVRNIICLAVFDVKSHSFKSLQALVSPEITIEVKL